MRWGIVIAGAILAALDKLTTWWGIAIIVVLALIHFMDAFAGVDRRAREVHDEPNVFEFLRFLLISLPMIAAVFIGNAIAGVAGVLIGGIGIGLLGSFTYSLIEVRETQAMSEREYE